MVSVSSAARGGPLPAPLSPLVPVWAGSDGNVRTMGLISGPEALRAPRVESTSPQKRRSGAPFTRPTDTAPSTSSGAGTARLT